MIAHTWNTDRDYLADGSVRSVIGGGWRNYIRRQQVWQPINTAINADRSVTAFPGCLQLPESAQGWADICIDGTFSMKRHADEGNGHNAEPEFHLSLAVEAQHNVTGHISETNPAQMIYPGAWDSADLKLGLWQGRSVRIEKVVDIHTMPAGDSEFIQYSFLVRSSTAQVLAGPNHDISPWDNGHAELNGSDAFVAFSGSRLRGTVLRTPVAWYYANGQMVRVPVRVTFDVLSDGETVRATKHIPRTLIATALAAGSHLFTDATFNPDSNPETSSVDGWTVTTGHNLSWTSLIAEAATFARDGDSSEDFYVHAASASNQWSALGYLHFLFDTSSIGTGQAVDTASLTLNIDRQNTAAFGLEWNVYSSSPASNTAIATGDHANVGTTPFSTARVMNDEPTDPTAIEMAYNSDGRDAVDVAGVSKFAIATQEDVENGTYGDPSWISVARSTLRIRMAEYTGTSSDPLLTVTSSAVSTFTPAWALAANQ